MSVASEISQSCLISSKFRCTTSPAHVAQKFELIDSLDGLYGKIFCRHLRRLPVSELEEEMKPLKLQPELASYAGTVLQPVLVLEE